VYRSEFRIRLRNDTASLTPSMIKPRSTRKKKPASKPRPSLIRVPKKVDAVLARKNPDGSLSILHLDADEKIYLIEGIAAEVFTLIDGTRSIEKISEKITLKHSPPEAKFGKDLSAFLKWLSKNELIRYL
jgi:hypothetical protein